MLGENECRLTGGITQNNIPILEDNYVRKMNANRGFSKERLFRKIGSIPLTVWLNAHQEGWNLDDEKEIYKFLAQNPSCRSVTAIDSGHTGQIIIK